MEETEDGVEGSEQTMNPYKSSPTRPWQCRSCGWYMAIPKAAGCPYCSPSASKSDSSIEGLKEKESESEDKQGKENEGKILPPKKRDKDSEPHPATFKTREQDSAVSQARLVNIWNVGQSKNSTIPAKQQGALRFVCISDTHNRHEDMVVPKGDVLIHSGDFTLAGGTEEIEDFVDWMESLPHQYKIVVAGNHDTTMYPEWYDVHSQRYHSEKAEAQRLKEMIKSKFIYLEDSMIEIEGRKIYGSPWTLTYHDWVFQLDEGDDIKQIWDLIPIGVDVLVTHNPPSSVKRLSIGVSGHDAGCSELTQAVARVKPRVHVFGHVHEGYGVFKSQPTTFINACSVNRAYKPVNKPIVFDLL